MADEVQVVTESVRAEANKWRELAGEMQPLKAAVDGLALGATAFWMGPSPDFVMHHQAYQQFQQSMSTVLNGAVTEFNQLAEALDRIADEYDRADEIVAVDLDSIYTAP